MRLTLHQLRLFAAVAQEGSISRAAERLCLTQPTLSAQLRQLTDQVGLPLYEVIGRRLHLTEAGEVLLASADEVAGTLERLEEEIAARRGLTQGRLKLAVVSTAEYFMPRLLGEFRQRHPRVEVALAVQNRAALIERLKDNADDLYVMSSPPEQPPVRRQPFLANPLVALAPRAHPWVGRRLTLADLAEEEFIQREAGSGTRLAVDSFLAERGVRLDARLELGSNEAIKQAVAGRLGLAILSRHALGPRPDESGVAVLDVAELPIPSRWHVVYPEGKQLSPLARAFLDFLNERAPELARSVEAA
ncbi:LysR family transcriptional regulator [Oryzomicrobium sp.]|uniref:LysR family transcriptional regulator n=1 Tax=Oryzomicrobium sp. TaxID=1911578 RepID=UPI0025D45036|nr:LysR family transcriptional regulator [Oryzomicrobium sp.]MCE1244434.1 LysR family transcriptional regulator [Oryzomicrobium sp.]